MKLEAKNPRQANLFIKWICLNECNFQGNDEAVVAHKPILRSYRQSVATVSYTHLTLPTKA